MTKYCDLLTGGNCRQASSSKILQVKQGISMVFKVSVIKSSLRKIFSEYENMAVRTIEVQNNTMIFFISKERKLNEPFVIV